MFRTKDYRIVINKTTANISEYIQQVDLKCIDTEQEIYKKASIWVESFGWKFVGQGLDPSNFIYILSDLPQVRTVSNITNFNLGSNTVLEAIPTNTQFLNNLYETTAYYTSQSNSHRVAIPITMLQSNFNVSISNKVNPLNNTMGLGDVNLILRIELSE